MSQDVVIVGGTFDTESGKPSYFVDQMSSVFSSSKVINGGNIELIRNLDLTNAKVLIWMPNIDNTEPKILLDIKKRSPRLLLVSSKRAVEKEYSDFEIVSKLLKTRSNLGIVIRKIDNKYSFSLLDPLGNRFVVTSLMEKLAVVLKSRIKFLMGITRVSSDALTGGNTANLKDAYQSEVNKEFINLVRHYGTEFTKYVNAMNPSRFLGNASTRTRCMYGFPSARLQESVMVTRRNVDKEGLSQQDFIPVNLMKSDYLPSTKREVLFIGEHKPSVDSPIQLHLYEKLKNINFMIHGHVYLENSQLTKEIIPCGGIEEVQEVLNLVRDTDTEQFLINLRGHGFLAGARTVEGLIGLKFRSRGLPEEQFSCL